MQKSPSFSLYSTLFLLTTFNINYSVSRSCLPRHCQCSGFLVVPMCLSYQILKDRFYFVLLCLHLSPELCVCAFLSFFSLLSPLLFCAKLPLLLLAFWSTRPITCSTAAVIVTVSVSQTYFQPFLFFLFPLFSYGPRQPRTCTTKALDYHCTVRLLHVNLFTAAAAAAVVVLQSTCQKLKGVTTATFLLPLLPRITLQHTTQHRSIISITLSSSSFLPYLYLFVSVVEQ